MSKSILTVVMVLLVFASNATAQSTDGIISKTDVFLKNYVNSGLVDYQLIKNNINELNELMALYHQVHLAVGDEKKALLINLYNLGAIKLLADQYPVGSPQEISGFYDKKFITYQGSLVSLNDIENNVIRKEYNDPRVHFVLVCGALGCPPITNFAYTSGQLDEQMTQQTKMALNNSDFIKVNEREVLVSEIFKWYEGDFLKTNKSVIEFINKYRTVAIDSKLKLDYYPYDWKINEMKSVAAANPLEPYDPSEEPTKKKTSTQEFTPSVLYTKGQWEYKFFNNLYSQTHGFDKDGNKVDYKSRGSYFSSINQALFGVSSRFNVGVDFWVKSVQVDNANSSPFDLLQFESNSTNRTALTNIGPKVKFLPFKKLSHLSIQSTFLIPVAKDQEGKSNGKPYLSDDSYISITQIFYDYSINRKFQLFFQLSPWVYIKKTPVANTERATLSTPADFFLSYFPNDRLTLFVQEQFWPNFRDNEIASWFRQEGLGAKYQIIKGKLEIETSYTRFTIGRNAGAGVTYNLGLRFIHL